MSLEIEIREETILLEFLYFGEKNSDTPTINSLTTYYLAHSFKETFFTYFLNREMTSFHIFRSLNN